MSDFCVLHISDARCNISRNFISQSEQQWNCSDAWQSANNFCGHKSTTCLANPAIVTIYQKRILRWFYVCPNSSEPISLDLYDQQSRNFASMKPCNQVIRVTLFQMLRTYKLKKCQYLESVIRQILSLSSCVILI